MKGKECVTPPLAVIVSKDDDEVVVAYFFTVELVDDLNKLKNDTLFWDHKMKIVFKHCPKHGTYIKSVGGERKKLIITKLQQMPYHLTWSSFSTCPEENSRRCMASDRPWFTLPLSPTLIFFCIAPLFPHLEPSLIIFPSYSKVWPKKWEFLQTSWRPVKITIPLLWLWVGKLELTMLFWQRAFSSVCNYTAYAIKFFL